MGLSAAWGGLWAPWEIAAFSEPGPLLSASVAVLGRTAFAARLPGVVCVALTAWLTYRLGATWLGRRAGVVAACVLLTCPVVLLQGGRLLGDAPRMAVEALVVASACVALPRAAAVVAFFVPIVGAALVGADGGPVALDAAVRQLGLGLFPWICLVPGALGALVFAASDEGPPDVLPAWVCGGLAAMALAPALGHAPLLTAAPAIALAIAAWPGPAGRAELAVVVVLGVVVAADALTAPGGVVGAVLPTAELPPLRLAWLHAAAVLGWAAWALTERGVYRSLGPALGVALVVAPLQTGALSRHLSRADAVDRWRQLAGPDEPLLAYKLGKEGDDVHAAGVEPIERLGELRRRLTDSPGRVFALLRTPDLVPVDGQFRRTTRGHVAVLDDRSSRVLLISNRLKPAEQDLNPLGGAVNDRPPPVTPLKRPAVLDGVVSLRGAELSASEVSPGGAFEVTLHFEVLDEVARRWKVLLHMERKSYRLPAQRTDHLPVGGLYGTERWRAGEHIADTHRIQVPWLSVPAGEYRLYAGRHQAEDRAPVTPAEAQDGQDRVLVGQIRVNSW